MKEGLIRHRIYDQLRAEIMSCDLQPGSEVREGELASKFGVSKSPIRDALQRLESEGLIEIAPRKGHRVAPISVSDAKDMLDMREMLEAGALRAAVVRASDADLKSLDALRDADTNDMNNFSEYNRKFHLRLCELSGNRLLADTMARLMESYDRLCIVSLSTRRNGVDSMTDALADHHTIIDALQARSATLATRASARHIRKSRSTVMQGLEQRPIVA